MTATNITVLNSQKITLADSASKVMRGSLNKIGIHIPADTTVTVYKTCAPSEVVNDTEYAGWVATSISAQAGPFIGTVDGPCTAIKITAGGSGGGGDVYVQYA